MEYKETVKKVIAEVCRLLLGVVFIFSGTVKAVDPMGGAIKIGDYLTSFGLDKLQPFTVLISFNLSALEFMLGVCMLLGVYRRYTTFLTLLMMSFMTPLTLYLGFGVLCGLGSGLSYNAVMSTMVRWFPDRPGLISGVLLMGFGGGSFLIGKLYQAWTPAGVGGWRTSFLVLGIVCFAVLAVCSFFFVAPGADFTAPAVKGGKTVSRPAAADVTPGQMLKKTTFWLYYVWAIAVSAAGLALISQASGVVWQASADQTAASVATIVGLISICNAVGRVLFGGMYDKYGRSLSMQLVNGLFILTSAVLLLAMSRGSVAVVILGFVLGGLAYSGVTPTNSAFCRAYFGPGHYPVNFPLINTNLIFASFGSTVSGALYDAGGSYNSTFLLIIGLAAVGIVCSLAISAIDKKGN